MKEEDFLNSKFLVCFYDVLGQKAWMDSAIKDGAILPEKQDELNRVAQSTNVECTIFRERIQDFCKDNGLELEEGIDYGVQQFSDSTVLYVRESIEQAPAILYLLLLDVSLHALEWQSIGLYLRGGITVGYLWPVEGGSFSGPALDEAGDLERITAFSQRIVFSDRFLQWLGKQMVDKKTSPKRREGLLSVNSLFAWGADTECYLNIFTPAIPQHMKEEGKLDIYRNIYRTAQALVKEKLWESRAPYAWKYFYLHDTFGVHEESLKDYVSGPWHKAEFAIKGLPNTPVGKYLVYYLKLLPLWQVPAKSEWVKSGRFRYGYSHSNSETINLLCSMLKKLSEWKRKCKDKYLPEEDCGVQQIGNYVMAYVSDNGVESLKALMRAVFLLQEMHLFCLERQHMVEGAITSGIGWSIAEDCLCGRVVGEADKMATENVPYPRVRISPEIASRITVQLCDWEYWPGIAAHVMAEIDGFTTWDPFGLDLIKHLKMRKINVESLLVGIFAQYSARQLLVWHFKYRTNESSSFARQLAAFLLLMRGRYGAWGFDDLLKTAEEKGIEYVKKIHAVEKGSHPWILETYTDLPEFRPRGNGDCVWVESVPCVEGAESRVAELLKSRRSND